MKINIKQYDAPFGEYVPIIISKESRRETYKLYKQFYGKNADYHLFQWYLINTLEGKLRREEYIDLINKRNGVQ